MSRYLAGAAAESEYTSARAVAVYVIDEDRSHGELRDCPSGQKPVLSEFVEKRAALIFPDDFAWTVAIGPDVWDRVAFTYREWVDQDADQEGPV
jgi:hypothetical protein